MKRNFFRNMTATWIILAVFMGIFSTESLAAETKAAERDQTDSTIAYFIDAGSYDPEVLVGDDQFGTNNSVTDQEYKEDPVTGYKWGYTGETVIFSGTTQGMPKEESSRFGKTGWDFAYRFALDEGTYDVEIYIRKEVDQRVFNVYATDKHGEAMVNESPIYASQGPHKLFCTIESSGTDSEVVLDFKKLNADNWDPVVSYIVIYDNETVITMFQDLIAQAESYKAEDYQSAGYQALQEAIGAAKAINIQAMEFPGRDLREEMTKLQQAIDQLKIINGYQVQFLADDKTAGTLPQDDFIAAGTDYIIPQSDLIRTGYVLEGWSYEGKIYQEGESMKMPSKGVLFTAAWAKVHTVTFTRNGGKGDLPEDIMGKAGSKVILPESSLSRAGYIFAGWSDGNSVYPAESEYEIPQEDVLLSAVWQRNQVYSISFAHGGGSGILPAVMVNEPETLVIIPDSSLTKEGYLFAGWSDGSKIYQPHEFIRMPAQDLFLAALWKIDPNIKPVETKTYTVQFAPNGGSKIPVQQVKAGEKIVEPAAPVRKGYTFAGWYRQNKKYDFSKGITEDFTLTAKWNKVKVPKGSITSIKNKKGKKAVCNIKKVSGAKGYRVVYSLDKKFKKGKKQILTTKNKPTVKPLKKGKTYYFKIQAYKLDSTNSKVYGKLSSYKKVKIKK